MSGTWTYIYIYNSLVLTPTFHGKLMFIHENFKSWTTAIYQHVELNLCFICFISAAYYFNKIKINK